MMKIDIKCWLSGKTPLHLVSYRTSQPLWLHDALLPTKTQHGSGERRNNLHLKNFNPAKSTKLLDDASQVGVGAVLTQDGKIISYASKRLSDVEKRYSQTEKEGLAKVWGIEHFRLYWFGSEFILTTEHKPLEIIFNNPRSKPATRIERWRLRLQPYDFKVEYRPGKGNPAGYLSRHPGQGVKTFRHSKIAEEYLNFVSSSKPKALTIKQITDASNKDPVIQEVITRMLKAERESSPNDPCIRSYFVNRDKLTIAPTENGSILLFEYRLIIPEHLQKTVVELAHGGHQGIVKTNQLLRDKVWFPGINQLVEEICKKCIPCAASTLTKQHEPLQMTETPDEPWSRVSADFCGPRDPIGCDRWPFEIPWVRNTAIYICQRL